MVLLYGILVLEYTPPVGAFPAAVDLGQDVLWYIVGPIDLGTRCVEVVLVKDGHVLLCIEKLWTLVGVRPSHGTIVAELDLAGLALLGGHQDHTVGSTGTVDGCRCSILQDIDALDVVGVDAVKVATCYTVDDVKRSSVTGGADTTDVDLVALTRLRGRLGNLYTRGLALHSFECVGSVQLGDVITLYLNGGTGQQLFLHGTVTDDDHVFE